MLNYYNTADEIIESGTDTCILPIGSVEQHGPHLPIGTDYILAESFAQAIGKELGCLVLPVQAYSTCYEHRGKMGSFWMKPETMYRVIEDLVTGMRAQGFKKIIILLSHGGIFIAGPVIRELNSIYPDIDVIKLDLVEFYLSKETNKYLECDNNLHAGEIESSLMVFLKKEYFRRDKVVDFIPDIPRSYLNNFPLLKVSPQGVWGKPSLATEEKGENIFNIVVKSAVEYLERFFLVLSKKT